ncbi:hypothetical protein F3X54_20955 [Salmonella enterica subsp. enterica]|nr:hypothetical protein [Salmonella enterica subsp. enterica serovar Lagos]
MFFLILVWLIFIFLKVYIYFFFFDICLFMCKKICIADILIFCVVAIFYAEFCMENRFLPYFFFDFLVVYSCLFCLYGRKDRKNDLFQNKHLYIIPGIKFVSFGNFLSQHQIEPEIIQ